MGHAVMPPLNDDVQLSVDEYRNKLYELMVMRTNAHTKHIKVNHGNRYRKVWHLVTVFVKQYSYYDHELWEISRLLPADMMIL